MTPPRAVIGVPTRNGERHAREAIESLACQRYDAFRVLVVDDASTDGTFAVAEEYASRSPLVEAERNQRRLGLVHNWRRAFERARDLYGEFEYFAWGSDHDVWHPRWLAALVRALDEDPQAVLAYPLAAGIDEAGETVARPRVFDTAGVASPRTRLRRTMHESRPGIMVYGLYRADALERCGVYRDVIAPDRLLLAQLALHGTFVQVPEILWQRRFFAGRAPSEKRQRAASFPEGAPLSARLPWAIAHAWTLGSSLVAGDGRPPGMSRLDGARATCAYLGHAVSYRARRRGRALAQAAADEAKEARAAWSRARGACARSLRRGRKRARKALRAAAGGAARVHARPGRR